MTAPTGRMLGLDIGERRIGVAVSDELGILASPVGFVARGPREEGELRALVARYRPVQLVAGLPVGLSGREGPQATTTRQQAERLAAALDLPLAYWDERLSTTIAERSLVASKTRRAKRRQEVDAAAAAVILQGYLDHAKYQRNRAG